MLENGTRVLVVKTDFEAQQTLHFLGEVVGTFTTSYGATHYKIKLDGGREISVGSSGVFDRENLEREPFLKKYLKYF